MISLTLTLILTNTKTNVDTNTSATNTNTNTDNDIDTNTTNDDNDTNANVERDALTGCGQLSEARSGDTGPAPGRSQLAKGTLERKRARVLGFETLELKLCNSKVRELTPRDLFPLPLSLPPSLPALRLARSSPAPLIYYYIRSDHITLYMSYYIYIILYYLY